MALLERPKFKAALAKRTSMARKPDFRHMFDLIFVYRISIYEYVNLKCLLGDATSTIYRVSFEVPVIPTCAENDNLLKCFRSSPTLPSFIILGNYPFFGGTPRGDRRTRKLDLLG